jgi:hypothetical protein
VNWSLQCATSTPIFLRLVSSLLYMFHQSSFGSVEEAAEFEDEFFLGGENATPKILERASGVDRNFDFLNRYSDGRSETADAKISLKRDRFTIHMLDSEVGWITFE